MEVLELLQAEERRDILQVRRIQGIGWERNQKEGEGSHEQ